MTIEIPEGSGAWDVDLSFLAVVANSIPWPGITPEIVQDVLIECKARIEA